MALNCTKADLEAAMTAGLLDASQLAELIGFLEAHQRGAQAPRFDLSHVLWYAGALIIIGSMGLFSTLAFSSMGGTALSATALIYAMFFTAAGDYLWRRRHLRTPGGLLLTVAITMAPLAVYGIQSQLAVWGSSSDPGTYTDFYAWSENSWIYMDIATLIASVLVIYFYPFPFIVAVGACAFWFLSMDFSAWLTGNQAFSDENAWTIDQSVSIAFGVGILVLAWIVDRKTYKNGDFAFWLHLFGLMILWGALTSSDSDNGLLQALYCALNVGFVLLSIFFMRRVYAVFGALGISLYLGNLAYDTFADSMLFPFALSLIGIAIIALGLLYHRQHQFLDRVIATHCPKFVLALRPAFAK
jgi:hypothetical protein